MTGMIWGIRNRTHMGNIKIVLSPAIKCGNLIYCLFAMNQRGLARGKRKEGRRSICRINK